MWSYFWNSRTYCFNNNYIINKCKNSEIEEEIFSDLELQLAVKALETEKLKRFNKTCDANYLNKKNNNSSNTTFSPKNVLSSCEINNNLPIHFSKLQKKK